MIDGPVSLKFEHLLDIMLYTYQFQMDQININREIVETSMF